jgi:hypothetical protein
VKFFSKKPKTVTREDANRVRRESKDHIVAASEGVALHGCWMPDGTLYIVDEALKKRRR